MQQDLQNRHKGKTGLTRIWSALLCSLDGLAAAFRHEDAFRQEVVIALVLIPVALALPASGLGKAMMVASVLLVLIVELLNSAIESVTDRVSLEHHVLAKRAKDMGSAAVMLSLINVPVVWLLVLLA
jgi:diacylglycerol kinase (ATP)